MAEKNYKRKLSAILSADVKGYSLLMTDDELATVTTLKSHKESMTSVIQEHDGRVVDSPGDNLLAEFASAMDAVKSAVKIQEELKAKNAELPEERRMQFRIGINIGDVIHENDRIYGDGVNVAARIESLADPGGVCVSRSVCDQVKQKLELGFQYLGEHAVKNISEPVRVYRVLMHPETAGKVIGEKRFLGKMSQRMAICVFIILAIAIGGSVSYYIYLHQTGRIEAASIDKMAFPLPEKPSIAILPFDNLSGDPDQEYFSDGLSEEIIATLSKAGEMFVIARNSSFIYKSKPVKVQQVSEELGVRYVLEGSVRKDGDRVRVTAQLIDAIQGKHLWAERYDREIKNVFEIQDEITRKIVTALRIELTEGEQARIWGSYVNDHYIYVKQMEMLSLWRKGSKESLIRFGQIAQEIIKEKPEAAAGYMGMAWYYWQLAIRGISPQESTAKAFKFAQKTISIDETPGAYGLLGNVYLLMRKYEKAIAYGKKAIDLDPNGAMMHALLGLTLSFADKPDEGITHLKQALRLNPYPPYWYYLHLTRCYLVKGLYEEALLEVEKATKLAPEEWANYVNFAIVYSFLDRKEDAHGAAAKLFELNPNFSMKQFLKTMVYKDRSHIKLILDTLKKAGVPDRRQIDS